MIYYETTSEAAYNLALLLAENVYLYSRIGLIIQKEICYTFVLKIL